MVYLHLGLVITMAMTMYQQHRISFKQLLFFESYSGICLNFCHQQPYSCFCIFKYPRSIIIRSGMTPKEDKICKPCKVVCVILIIIAYLDGHCEVPMWPQVL